MADISEFRDAVEPYLDPDDVLLSAVNGRYTSNANSFHPKRTEGTLFTTRNEVAFLNHRSVGRSNSDQFESFPHGNIEEFRQRRTQNILDDRFVMFAAPEFTNLHHPEGLMERYGGDGAPPAQTLKVEFRADEQDGGVMALSEFVEALTSVRGPASPEPDSTSWVSWELEELYEAGLLQDWEFKVCQARITPMLLAVIGDAGRANYVGRWRRYFDSRKRLGEDHDAGLITSHEFWKGQQKLQDDFSDPL